ncbi:S-layer homology domain-containing protein [Paenisporosarcina indica]|uniref:S-layer homology domain-containing protein n=1 Tax=Paenisporosarcina indica TaxID=650093 RepID=UPI00095022BA|nr:S-layer homology domain-containing protein [Paenisporosarcina indica]
MKWRVAIIMRETWKRRIISVTLLFVLVLSLVVPNASANAGTVNYLALGDSLAAGSTPYKTLDNGYSDFTAAALKEKNLLGSYSKAFAVPGDKTNDVLEDLTTNVQVREAVKSSNTITISAGAIDLLKDAKLDSEKKVLVLDETKIPGNLKNVAVNYSLILNAIKELNPQAQVYVMGYYFPFPYVADVQKPKLIELTHTLNKTIESVAVSQGATFVSVYEKFGNDPKAYLPNPLDIHPNTEGYKLMSEALLESLAKRQVVAKDVPAGHWAEKELNLLLASKVYNLDEKGNVYPEQAITRGEVANILFGLIPLTKSIPVNPGYKDVSETHPFYMAIAKLTEAGVFTKDTNFNPDAPLTRVQLAKVVALAFQLKGDGTTPAYKDISKSYWATPYISALTSTKIMNGYSNGAFGLHDKTTKAQFAVILVRIQAKTTAQ